MYTRDFNPALFDFLRPLPRATVLVCLGVVLVSLILPDTARSAYARSVTDEFQPAAPFYAAYYHPIYTTPSAGGEWRGWQAGDRVPLTRWASHYLPDRLSYSFDPARELYSVLDVDTFFWQLDQMAQARIEVAVSDWRGPGDETDAAFDRILNDFMVRRDNPYPNLRWALHYRAEAEQNPGVVDLVVQLDHIAERYASQAAYLRIDGRPVLFVDAAPDEGEELVIRWAHANALAATGFHLVLRNVEGAAAFGLQPDGWHDPTAHLRVVDQSPAFFSVSPGYWPYDEEAQSLTRDLPVFQADLTAMVDSDARWKLIVSWNNWQDGSAVEPGDPVTPDPESGRYVFDSDAPAFQAAYVQVLAATLPELEDGRGEPLPRLTEPGTVPPARSFEFAAGGDHSFSNEADATLTALGRSDAEFYLALGDLSYSTTGGEDEWCAFVTERVGAGFPFQLLAGNHEDQPEDGTFIDAFAECLPTRLPIFGQYAHRYSFDYPTEQPLARFILIDPALYRGDERMHYCADGERANCNWLTARIQEAKAAGLWVIVAMHKTCINVGTKGCEIGAPLMDLLIDLEVDLVLQGHEHNYARSHQLSHSAGCRALTPHEYNPACVAAAGSEVDLQRGNGTMVVINGAMGKHLRPVYPEDPEAPYFATWMGQNMQPSFGFVRLGISACRLQGEFSAAVGEYADVFSIVDRDATPDSCPTVWTPAAAEGATSAVGTIRPEVAGKLTVTDPVTVSASFPSGSVVEPVTVKLTISRAETLAEQAARVKADWAMTDFYFALDATEEDGGKLKRFQETIALRITYNDDGATSTNPNRLKVARYSERNASWIVQATRFLDDPGVFVSNVDDPGLYTLIDTRPAVVRETIYIPSVMLSW